MNEPQSIAAEILAMTILAGESPSGQPLVKFTDFTPYSRVSSTLWPVAPFSSLLGGDPLPKGQAWILTYLSLYTTAADESQLSVNYGFNWTVNAFIQVQSGTTFNAITAPLLSQVFFNRPLFMIFDPETIPRIVLSPSSSTQAGSSVLVNCYAHGFLIPAGLSSAFKPFQSRFPSS